MSKLGKTLNLRSRVSILREYNRVQKMLRKAAEDERTYLYGAQQALAWAFDDSAQAASKAFAPRRRK